jgi:hypothetical protein
MKHACNLGILEAETGVQTDYIGEFDTGLLELHSKRMSRK